MTKLVSAFALSLLVNTSANEAPRQFQTYAQASDYTGLMLERVNMEREAQRLPPLCMNTKLQHAAQRHSDDQATNNFMDHTGSDGSALSERVTDSGYHWRKVAENVAVGQADVAEVMDAWMNSEGHRVNILGDYNMLGSAYAYNRNGPYHHFWTQDFGLSDTEQCDDGSAPNTFYSIGALRNMSIEQTEIPTSPGGNVMLAPIPRNPRITSGSSVSNPPALVQAAAIVVILIVLLRT